MREKIRTNHQVILYDDKYRNGTTQYKIRSSKNKFQSYFHHFYSASFRLPAGWEWPHPFYSLLVFLLYVWQVEVRLQVAGRWEWSQFLCQQQRVVFYIDYFSMVSTLNSLQDKLNLIRYLNFALSTLFRPYAISPFHSITFSHFRPFTPRTFARFPCRPLNLPLAPCFFPVMAMHKGPPVRQCTSLYCSVITQRDSPLLILLLSVLCLFLF